MINATSNRRSFHPMALVLACMSAGILAGCQLFEIPSDIHAHVLPPLDPQRVQDQDDMTWADYRPIPGVNWADPVHRPSQRTIRVALVAADFEDQPFVITLPKHSDLFGNPQVDPVKREEVARFYTEFWNGRSPLRDGHTVSEDWMEQSHGKIGVTFDAFGPYRMPRKVFQYGLREFGQNNSGPEGVPIDGNLTQDCDALWRADAGENVRSGYQLVLRYFAGYDETCLWQEFGEMKFQTRDDIPPEWGSPDPNKPRWAPTRYVPWTSWKAASMPWSNSAIINGESSGSIVHEVSHAAFSIGDNNNNPYVTPYRRVGSGPWDIMDRGSFNGPGGPHNRWQVPVVQGGAMPAGIMLRQKLQFGFISPSNVVQLSREGLAGSGLAVATIMARSADPGSAGLAGITVRLDGPTVPLQGMQAGGRGGRGGEPAATGPATAPPTEPAAGGATGRGGARGAARGGLAGRGGAARTTTADRTPWSDPATDPLSHGIADFNFYSLEVVQRIGYDSFSPDSGVLLAKNKDRASNTGGPNGYSLFNWVIDAHPEDIHKVDFIRPNGEKVMRTIADYRQLNDALFHAGLNSGSQYEWQDAPNRLHFYIIDTRMDDRGILWYTLGIRSLDGSGPQNRGVSLAAHAPPPIRRPLTPCGFILTNTGTAAPSDPALHPQDASGHLNQDVYRLSASIDATGWSAQIANALAAVPFGQSQSVPVYVTRAAGAARSATVTLTATSESDPSKTMSATCRVSAP